MCSAERSSCMFPLMSKRQLYINLALGSKSTDHDYGAQSRRPNYQRGIRNSVIFTISYEVKC
jgi:hypothetical protein